MQTGSSEGMILMDKYIENLKQMVSVTIPTNYAEKGLTL